MSAGQLLGRWGPAVAYMGLIFQLSSLASVPNVAPDTVSHLLEYVGLGALLLRAIAPVASPVAVRRVVLAGLLGGLYGLSDEFHQRFVPGRQAEWKDVVMDQIGALLGACGTALALRRRQGLPKGASR